MFAPELAGDNDGFSREFFAQLHAIEDSHFWFGARNQLLIWALQTYFPTATSLLEVGCGTGFVLSAVQAAAPNVSCSGAEIFLEGLAFAAERVPSVTLAQMSALRIPYDAAFDVVGAFDVLEHIAEDTEALSEMFRATIPGGGVLITVPQHASLWSPVDDHSHHKRRYSRADLVQKLRAAGFANVRTTSFVSLLLPLMMVARRQARGRRSFDAEAEVAISRPLNTVLGAIMTTERALIRLGVTFPIGGSLLAVAHRPRSFR